MACAMSGLTADAKTLIDHARAETQVRVPARGEGSHSACTELTPHLDGPSAVVCASNIGSCVELHFALDDGVEKNGSVSSWTRACAAVA